MVLTRSQTKLQLEKEMMLIENELQLDKVTTQNQNLLEEKAFIDNMKQMLNEFEKRQGDIP